MLTTHSKARTTPLLASRRKAPRNVRVLQRRGALTTALVLIVVLVFGAVLLSSPLAAAVAVIATTVGVAVLAWIWRAPVRGLYVLFGLAVMQETTYSGNVFSDDLGYYTPIFQDISTWTHISGISFSVAEVFMLLVALIWLCKGIADRTLHFDRGVMMLPLGLYILMVGVAEAHGLSSGGDFKLSLWEVRAQAYMLITYILACNLVKTRAHLNTLLWIVVVGTGIKGVQGVWRYLITLHGSIHSVEALFPHEQSYFYNLFLTLALILPLYGGSKRLKRVTYFFLPFILIASLANQRRAAILAIAFALIGLLLITIAANPRRRRAGIAIVALLLVVFPPYYLAFKDSTGLIGQPAHAISSNFTPDARDQSSNNYRINEDKDILATMRLSPIIGYGYGKKMAIDFPLYNISGAYVFWNLLPHDSILWVFMRTGLIGFFLLWVLIGTALVRAVEAVRRLDDAYLKGIAVFCILAIIQEIIFGYLDLQWTNYRNLIAIGVMFATISRLFAFALAVAPEQQQRAERRVLRAERLRGGVSLLDTAPVKAASAQRFAEKASS